MAPRATPARRHAPLDETAVVRAAIDVLATVGVDGISLSVVAKHLGVTQPALYRHVGGIDALLARLALEARRRLLDALRDAAVGRSGADAVRAIANVWRDFARAHPALYAVTDRSPLAGDAANEVEVANIVRIITRVLDAYRLDPHEAEHAAWAMRSALHGFADLEIRSGNPSSTALDVNFDRLVALLVAGLERWDEVAAPELRDR